MRDILKRYTGEEIRYFLLSGHYRSPINFSEELMTQSRNALGRMHNAKQNLEHLIRNGSDLMTEAESAELEKTREIQRQIRVCDGRRPQYGRCDQRGIRADPRYQYRGEGRASKKEFAGGCMELLRELTGVLGILQDEEEDRISERNPGSCRKNDQEAERRKILPGLVKSGIFSSQKGLAVEDRPQGLRV